MQRLDTIIETALLELDSPAANHFRINDDRDNLPRSSSYSFAGNSVGSARGGVIDGPRNIHRRIVIADDVDFEIEIDSDWIFIAGKPYVTINLNDANDNPWFLERLKDKLQAKGVTVESGG